MIGRDNITIPVGSIVANIHPPYVLCSFYFGHLAFLLCQAIGCVIAIVGYIILCRLLQSLIFRLVRDLDTA